MVNNFELIGRLLIVERVKKKNYLVVRINDNVFKIELSSELYENCKELNYKGSIIVGITGKININSKGTLSLEASKVKYLN